MSAVCVAHDDIRTKMLCEMAFDDFHCSSHECSVNCHTLSARNAFLKNKFSKYHHFLSLSILFLSIEDETIPPFVGYILSKYLRDSFKKFWNCMQNKCILVFPLFTFSLYKTLYSNLNCCKRSNYGWWAKSMWY